MSNRPKIASSVHGTAGWLLLAAGIVACQAVQPPTVPTASQGKKGADCSEVVRVDPSSAAAAEIVDDFLHGFHEQQPTEYMGFEQLWGVDELDGFILIQGIVTPEESDLIVGKGTEQGLVMVARITSHLRDVTAESAVADLLGQAPDIPEALLACAEMTRFLESLSP
jgi:hypothetical protein